MLHLKIYTPSKIILDNEAVLSISCQTIEGEITILSRHTALLTLLREGVITVREKSKEEYFSAGSGYVETDGKNVKVLISTAFGQAELDEKKIIEVKEQAVKLLKEQKDKVGRDKVFAMLRRAGIDLKVIRKLKRKVA